MRGAFLAAVSLTALAAAAPASAATLNLLIWESYIDAQILADFTAETGIEVRQTFYDSGDARDEILADPSSNIDVVVTNENGAKLYGNRGIIMALDVDTVFTQRFQRNEVVGALGIPGYHLFDTAEYLAFPVIDRLAIESDDREEAERLIEIAAPHPGQEDELPEPVLGHLATVLARQ